MGKTISEMGTKIVKMDQKIDALMLKNKCKLKSESDEGRADRERLKERLKKCMTDSATIHRTGWLELVFGIRRADNRMGKEGSRSHTLPKNEPQQMLSTTFSATQKDTRWVNTQGRKRKHINGEIEYNEGNLVSR